MNYKALMVDVDGTLIPYHYASFPSKKVLSSLREAQKKLAVCLVTGRAYNAIEPILNALPGTAYAVTNGGAIVIEIKTKKSQWKIFANSVNCLLKKNMILRLKKQEKLF
jgi:hydroxymethylpyrimidine pyrophosphatase-like HAD family hydrolase